MLNDRLVRVGASDFQFALYPAVDFSEPRFCLLMSWIACQGRIGILGLL